MVERSFMILLLVAAILAACLGAYAALMSAVANGEVSYCYVDYYSPSLSAPQYHLYGFRPWRQDRIIGNFTTLDEAQKAAETIKCPLLRK